MKNKTSEPEIDESLLTKEQYEELHRRRNLKPWIIFASVLLGLMAVCIAVILICQNV